MLRLHSFRCHLIFGVICFSPERVVAMLQRDLSNCATPLLPWTLQVVGPSLLAGAETYNTMLRGDSRACCSPIKTPLLMGSATNHSLWCWMTKKQHVRQPLLGTIASWCLHHDITYSFAFQGGCPLSRGCLERNNHHNVSQGEVGVSRSRRSMSRVGVGVVAGAREVSGERCAPMQSPIS